MPPRPIRRSEFRKEVRFSIVPAYSFVGGAESRTAASRRTETDMTSRITSFSELFSTLWLGWKQMLHLVPLWDPYGAALSLALGVVLLGAAIKKVMD